MPTWQNLGAADMPNTRADISKTSGVRRSIKKTRADMPKPRARMSKMRADVSRTDHYS